MITELEYLQEQIAVAGALIRLTGLQQQHDRLFGEGSYAKAVAAVQKSLTPSQSLSSELS